MTAGFPYLLCLLYSMIVSSYSQYINIRKPNKSTCEDSNNTAMVEHFFNVIFTEFHTTPPVCICVQMCIEQPTYCYPNGCLKKIDNKRKNVDNLRPPTIGHLQSDEPTRSMFVVDEKNNYANILNSNAEAIRNAQRQTTEATEFFSDPLKDMYNTLFKLKRMPKVELRYNLREQVKNSKSDILRHETEDVSKTRWPQSHLKIYRDQKVYVNDKSNDGKVIDAGNVSFFPSNPERRQDSYTSKYFKRDLSKSENDSFSEANDKVFSIEALIENLIGNSYEGADETTVDSKIKHNCDNRTADLTINVTENEGENDTIDNKKDVMSVLSLNLTNENVDKNKYADDSPVAEVVKKWSNYTFNEMISALSKQIDVQNNTSMEMIKHISGNNSSLPTDMSLITSAGTVNVEIVKTKAVTAEPKDKAVLLPESQTNLKSTNFINSSKSTSQLKNKNN